MPIRKRPQWLGERLLTLLILIPLEFQEQAKALREIADQETAWADARAVFELLRTRSLLSERNPMVEILDVIAEEICNSSQPTAPFDRDVAGLLLHLLAPFFRASGGANLCQFRDIERALFRRPMHVAWPAK